MSRFRLGFPDVSRLRRSRVHCRSWPAARGEARWRRWSGLVQRYRTPSLMTRLESPVLCCGVLVADLGGIAEALAEIAWIRIGSRASRPHFARRLPAAANARRGAHHQPPLLPARCGGGARAAGSAAPRPASAADDHAVLAAPCRFRSARHGPSATRSYVGQLDVIDSMRATCVR